PGVKVKPVIQKEFVPGL
nr:beta 2m- class I-binding peptide X80a=major histocompatibility complex H-2Kb-specific molecule poorly associated with beta 2-microglobulin [mice, NSO plasmacytoma cell line, Kb-high cells, Peptide Partial, 17 aa] [Mus sp.]